MTAILPCSNLVARAPAVLAALRARGWTLATAESCTGGLIAATLTAIAGSSDVVECGFVTYADAAKTRMLGVPTAMLREYGAVSEPVAAAMAAGALANSTAQIAVAVTGIAGPGGAMPGKKVGLIWFGCAVRGASPYTVCHVFPGDRDTVRAATVAMAFDLLLAAASLAS